MHRLLGRWSRGIDLPNRRTVLVIDEAGMAATRELEPLVRDAIDAGGRHAVGYGTIAAGRA